MTKGVLSKISNFISRKGVRTALRRSTAIAVVLAVALVAVLGYAAVKHKCTTVPAITVVESNARIIIDGKEVDFEKLYGRPVLNVNGRIMLPLRAFAYYIFNHDPTKDKEIVFYQQKTNDPSIRPDRESINHIWIEKDGYRVDFWEGYVYLSVKTPYENNPVIIKTDVPPLVFDEGYTYLPFRVQAYAFRYGVEWDEKTNTVYLWKGGAKAPSIGEPVVFEPQKNLTQMNHERGSIVGPGIEIFPRKWTGKDNGYYTLSQPGKETLPYQKYIDKGWLKPYDESLYAADKRCFPNLKVYETPRDKLTPSQLLEIAYDPDLKNSGRFILVLSIIYNDGRIGGIWLYDYGKIEDLIAGKAYAGYKYGWPEKFDLKNQRIWELLSGNIYFNLVSINGVPWQESEYSSLVLKEYQSSPAVIPGRLEDPYYLGIILDKRNNLDLLHKLWDAQNDAIGLKVGNDKVLIYEGQKIPPGEFYPTNEIKLPFKIFKENGVMMVPLKPAIQGLKGSYSQQGKDITIVSKKKTYKLQVGSNTAYKNGAQVRLSRAVVEKYGYTFMPLTDFEKLFEFSPEPPGGTADKVEIFISDIWAK